MKPYGLRLDHHRYKLNDNGYRDAVFAAVARTRERTESKLDAKEQADSYGEFGEIYYVWDGWGPDYEDCVWCGECLCCNCNGCVGIPHRPLTFRLEFP